MKLSIITVMLLLLTTLSTVVGCSSGTSTTQNKPSQQKTSEAADFANRVEGLKKIDEEYKNKISNLPRPDTKKNLEDALKEIRKRKISEDLIIIAFQTIAESYENHQKKTSTPPANLADLLPTLKETLSKRAPLLQSQTKLVREQDGSTVLFSDRVQSSIELSWGTVINADNEGQLLIWEKTADAVGRHCVFLVGRGVQFVNEFQMSDLKQKLR